ncbi:MAG: hypothetical protein HQ581_17130 [Planctomycetes bacterium]|nr:hypothetical protein [Planctomycetota bacterium]
MVGCGGFRTATPQDSPLPLVQKRRGHGGVQEDPASFAAWSKCSLTVAGAGMLGQRITTEAVRAGTRVHLIDMDIITDPFKLGRRFGETGQFKAVAVKAAADAIRPGYVEPWVTDARHHGVGAYASTGVILDASDDPTLAVFLTTVSNGLGVPLIRVAVAASHRRAGRRSLRRRDGRPGRVRP